MNRPNTRKKTSQDTIRSILLANGQENAPLFNLAKTPKELEVPKEVKEESLMGVGFLKTAKLYEIKLCAFQFCQVACGTEHILLLTSQGRVYTLGINRFGQCGLGHKQPVVKLTVNNILLFPFKLEF